MTQIDPRKQPGTDKMLGVTKPARKMSGSEIGRAMSAWARRTQ